MSTLPLPSVSISSNVASKYGLPIFLNTSFSSASSSVPEPSEEAQCTQMRYGEAGDYCQTGQGRSRCNTRTYCAVQPGSREGECVAYPDLDEACDGRLPCRRGWCKPPDCTDLSQPCSLGRAGVCTLYQDLGEACTSTAQCGMADSGRFCSSQNRCSGEAVNRCE